MGIIFGNPVHGPIHPSTWRRPAGNRDFRLTQRFGCTGVTAEPPFGSCAHYHRGIDLGNTACGAEVLAVASGKVTLAGVDASSWGALRVVIAHPGGWFSLYYHLHDIAVKVGQTITRGQVLGHVGLTGRASACHLHFEVHESSDRLSFFDPWPHFEQNVTVRPAREGVNIRASAGSGSTPGPVFATTRADGHIYRTDGADIGLTATGYPWGNQVTGATYTVGGSTSDKWERIYIDGGYRVVASLLAIRSV